MSPYPVRLVYRACRAAVTRSAFALSLALLLAVSSVIAAGLQVRVVAVSDGDTITVIDGLRNRYKVRLTGIDAPEKSQAFGDRSRQALASRVFDQEVIIELGQSDRYGRILSKVVMNGADVNLKQVVSGMAWHYRKYQKDQTPEDRVAYLQAESAARAAGVGLWRDRNATPPWDYRKSRKGE